MKRTLRKDEARPAGYTFWIPTVHWLGADRKRTRPYFLVARVEDAPQLEVMGTLALMTTKDTEGTQYGAYLHRIRVPGTSSAFPTREPAS